MLCASDTLKVSEMMNNVRVRDFESDAEESGLLNFPTGKRVKVKDSDSTDTSSEGTEDDRTSKMTQAFKTIIEVRADPT